MTSEIKTYSVQQVAELTGLSAHTLRYYERIELIPPVDRDDNGYRCYSQEDVGKINFLCCLIQTKMPLAQVKRYAALYAYGEESNDERIAILLDHREQIQQQVDGLLNTLAMVDRKLAILHPEQVDTSEAT